MERVWYTIEDINGKSWDAYVGDFGLEEYASEYDEYNDAALVAEGLRNCSVIKHIRAIGVAGSHEKSVAGEF